MSGRVRIAEEMNRLRTHPRPTKHRRFPRVTQMCVLSPTNVDQAFDELERESPDKLRRVLHWLRDPKSRWVRIPLGVLFIVAGCLWFLPVVGIEMLPIGLLLIAQDVPFLKRPVGKMMLWLEHKWMAFRAHHRSKQS